MNTPLENEITERFGILPNFFRLASSDPAIAANLWGFAPFAYLDNPLPSLFKERLFVYLSRFCEVRYCIARHAGFLAGLGHASGDRKSRRQTIEEIVRLLRRPLPKGRELECHLSRCKEDPSLVALVDPDSNAARAKSVRVEYDEDAEEVIFGLASHVFLQTANAPACLDALRALLGESRLQHLMVFLAFVRTAHYWTRVHPQLTLEDDIEELLKTHEVLAQCVLSEPESVSDEVSRRLLDELALVRTQSERDSGLLAAIVDSSDDAIISKNLDGFITSWNKGAERVFGYTAREAVGQHITLIIPPERRDEETMILEQLRRGERIDHFETVRIRKDGAKVDISLTISPLRDAANRIIGASKVARDFTRRNQAERSLAEQARLLDLSNDAILVRDSADKITYWNKGAAELYGYTREEALGRVSHELLRTQFPESLERIIEHIQRENRWTGELIHKRKDESQIVVSSRWSLDRDDRGNSRAILETNNDITARKQAEDALRGSQNQLAIEVESLKLLQDISTQLIQEENVKTLYEKITDAAMGIMGSDYASLQVLDRQAGESGELLLLAYRGFNARAAQFWERVPAYTGSTCAVALRTGERVIASDVEKCVFMSGTEDLATYLQTGIHAVQSTPLLSRTGQVVGMISTHWRQVHTPDERELQVFDVLARQAADIIERRRAEEALRQSEERLRALADGLEAQVRTRTLELEERNREMLERTEQLRQLSSRLVRVQDEERRHIARELHDSVGQYLSGLLMVI